LRPSAQALGLPDEQDARKLSASLQSPSADQVQLANTIYKYARRGIHQHGETDVYDSTFFRSNAAMLTTVFAAAFGMQV
jgi:hypothetical protein